MEDQYGTADLRQFYVGDGANFFPAITRPPPDLLSAHRGFSGHPYNMLTFGADSSTSLPSGGGASGSCSGGGLIGGFRAEVGGDGGSGRWPRQETLTLLEIRSRLDPKFKEANQKGPLWEEVSRIMSEEHGYQRSGKKCREKFENLYKYYKKTKEGKAGRQDGKHYRFFRQLEALYGEPSNSASMSETHFLGGNSQYNYPINQESYPGPNLSDTSLISLSNSFNSDTTSSSDHSDDVNLGGPHTNGPKRKKGKDKRSCSKAKIRNFIDAKMRRVMNQQEAWMEKMMRTIELKEQERMAREEQWRKQDAARIEGEHKFWASERAWIEARDAALMDAFHKLTGNELRTASPPEDLMAALENRNDNSIWPECEITRLIQLRSGMESRFQQGGISEEVLWEEIASKMACLGHDRSALMCRNKWVSVNNYLLKCNKKRKENSKSCSYYHNHDEPICHQGGLTYCDTSERSIEHTIRPNDHGSSNTSNAINDSFFRFFIGDAYGRIMN